MTQYPVLVGYDHSPGAAGAVRWAQDEATRRRAPVRLVYVYDWVGTATPVPGLAEWPASAVREEAAAVVAQDFEPRLLSGVCGLSEWAVVDALDDAESNGLTLGRAGEKP